MIANDNALLLRIFFMTLGGQAMNWYNDLPQYSLYLFNQLSNFFLEDFLINIKKRSYVTDLMKMSQFDQESISNYMARWRCLIIHMNFSLSQEELVRLSNKICIKWISTYLQIQQHYTFE